MLVPDHSLKLSDIEHGQYLDGWLPTYTTCCRHHRVSNSLPVSKHPDHPFWNHLILWLLQQKGLHKISYKHSRCARVNVVPACCDVETYITDTSTHIPSCYRRILTQWIMISTLFRSIFKLFVNTRVFCFAAFTVANFWDTGCECKM